MRIIARTDELLVVPESDADGLLLEAVKDYFSAPSGREWKPPVPQLGYPAQATAVAMGGKARLDKLIGWVSSQIALYDKEIEAEGEEYLADVRDNFVAILDVLEGARKGE